MKNVFSKILIGYGKFSNLSLLLISIPLSVTYSVIPIRHGILCGLGHVTCLILWNVRGSNSALRGICVSTHLLVLLYHGKREVKDTQSSPEPNLQCGTKAIWGQPRSANTQPNCRCVSKEKSLLLYATEFQGALSCWILVARSNW